VDCDAVPINSRRVCLLSVESKLSQSELLDSEHSTAGLAAVLPAPAAFLYLLALSHQQASSLRDRDVGLISHDEAVEGDVGWQGGGRRPHAVHEATAEACHRASDSRMLHSKSMLASEPLGAGGGGCRQGSEASKSDVLVAGTAGHTAGNGSASLEHC